MRDKLLFQQKVLLVNGTTFFHGIKSSWIIPWR